MKKNKTIKDFAFCIASALLLSGCILESVPPPVAEPADKVFLMYDNINDSGGKPFSTNVAAAGNAIAKGALDADERVVVFEKLSTGNTIYELVKDAAVNNPLGYRKETLKKYEAGEYNKLDAATINAVVGDVRRAVPANHYGLAFGSHGMGWLPKSNSVSIAREGQQSWSEGTFDVLWEWSTDSPTRYFQGYGQNLDVDEFVEALDDWTWDFIILDDCFMACVEALYQMRAIPVEYIIASPTEIMLEGFPYDRVVNTVFAAWPDAEGVGREFVAYYRAKSSYPCATVAVVKMAQMDALAETVARLNLLENEIADAAELTGIQYYERLSRPGHLFYDMVGYLNRLRADRMPTEYNAFVEQFNRTVTYAGHTETFYSRYSGGGEVTITPEEYSGMNTFIPWSRTTALLDMYRTTEWWQRVYAK